MVQIQQFGNIEKLWSTTSAISSVMKTMMLAPSDPNAVLTKKVRFGQNFRFCFRLSSSDNDIHFFV